MPACRTPTCWNAWRHPSDGACIRRNGVIVEWAGVPGSGKTTLLQSMLQLRGQTTEPPWLQTFSSLLAQRLPFPDRVFSLLGVLARGAIWPAVLRRLRRYYYERILLSAAKLDFLYMNPALFRRLTELLGNSAEPVSLARDIDWLTRAFANYGLAREMLTADDVYVEDEGMTLSVGCVFALARVDEDAACACARQCVQLFPPIDLLFHVRTPTPQLVSRLLGRNPSSSLGRRLGITEQGTRERVLARFAALIDCMAQELRHQGVRVVEINNDGSRSPRQIAAELLSQIGVGDESAAAHDRPGGRERLPYA